MTAALVSKENNEVKFTLTFTGEEFDAETQKVYLAQRSKIAVDGFRKGKAPRSIIEKRYGEGIFMEDAVDNLLNDAYPKALDELGLEPVGYPAIDFGEEKLQKHTGFTVTVTVPVAPVVVPKDYKGVKAERVIKKITDADVNKELEVQQKANARLVVSEKAAEMGDTVILDYAGFVGEEQFEGGTAEGQSLELGSNNFIPGFEDQLVGCVAGSMKDVNVTFPEDYYAENLAGKEAVFHCTVHEVKTKEYPELNDDFASEVSEFETLDEMKADIKKNLEESALGAAEYAGKNAVMDKVYEANTFDVPQVMIDDEADNMVEEKLAQMSQQMSMNGLDIKTYFKLIGKTEADMKAEMRKDAVEAAEKRVKTRLLVKAIAAAEGIEASEEEVEKEFNDMAAMYGMKVEDVKAALAGQLTYLKEDIVSRKTIDFLYANAELTDVEEAAPAPAEEEEKAEEATEQ